MNPYGPSGFQNLSSNFEFNAENPNFSANSSISKPRLSKNRKHLNSKSKGGLEIKKNDVGSNPFRPVSENVIRGSSRVGDESSSFDADGFSSSSKGRHMKLKVSSKVEKVGNELIDEIRKLRIVNQSNDAQFSNVDNRLPSQLSQELNRMNLVGGGGGGSSGFPIAAELPNDLRKLNIRDSGEGDGGRKFSFSGSGNSDFVFGSGREKVDSVVDNTLHDNIKKLNISDGNQKKVNVDLSNRAFVSGRTGTVPRAGRTVDTMVFGEMEKLNIGGSSGGVGKDDGRQSSFSEKVPLAREQDRKTTAPQAPEFNKSSGLSGIPVSSKSPFPPGGVQYQMPSSDETQKREGFSFTSKQEGPKLSSVEFKTPEPKSNLFSGSNVNMAFRAKKGTAKVSIPRGRKGKVKVPNPVIVSFANNLSPMETSSQHGSSDSYSPMDVSPYCEIQDDAQSSGEAFPSNDAADEQLVTATERMDINDSSALKHGVENVDVPEFNVNTDVDRTTVIADSVSAVGDVSFKSAAEDLDNEVESKYKVEDSDQTQYFSASSSISSGVSSFKFAASSSSPGQAPVSMLHHRKKNRMKAGPDIYIPPRINTLSDATSSLQFSPISKVSVLPSQVGQSNAVFTGPFSTGISRNVASPKSMTAAVDNLGDAKRGTSSPVAANRGAQEACEKWRLRGNQAYANGDLKKAEECYTKGLSCIPRNETSRECLRSLVLCYSNRAAARMSVGRMSDALQDCLVAEQIDPNFFRVQLRAANCYLALGKISNASRYFKKLLQSTDVCVERKIILEASDGLLKAQKVSECVDRFSSNLRQGTFLDIESALDIIAEALVICPFSEKLLESKAEALFMLRRYEEVIQLCEETLEAAEKNFSTLGPNELSPNTDPELETYSFCTWRFGFIFKSNFYLGKLEEALEFLEKQEKWSSMVAKSENETLIPQLSTVRELVRHKSAGNGAFQQGKHTEAVEHYSAALSFNVESRPFAAVCFGNRAAAYQALGQITDAIADCSLAIALDESYSKAISRRATLFEMIRDYDQAAKDLERLVSLLTKQAEEKAPNPTGSISDLRQARQRLYQMEEQAKREIPLNFYLILDVEPSVSSIDLRKAYRKGALKHHPDKAGQSLARSECGDDGLWKEITEEVYKDADKLFKMIGEAYAVLSDPTKRSQYDIEEEMRNGTKKPGNMSRTPNDASVYTDERGGVGRQRREGWRSSANPYSRGFEPTRPGRYY